MIRIQNIEAQPEILQSRLVEENRNALVSRILGDAFAEKIASALEKYGFAGFHDDFLFRKAEYLCSLGDENEGVLCHEHVARLLLNPLMVFTKTEPADLQEAAVGSFCKIARDAE